MNQGNLFEASAEEKVLAKISAFSKKSVFSKNKTLALYADLNEKLKSNYNICNYIFYNNGLAIKFAPKIIKDNLKLAVVAIRNNIRAYEHLSENLKANTLILQNIIKADPVFSVLQIPESELKKIEVHDLIIKQILSSKKEIKTMNTQVILKKIFSKNLSDTMGQHKDIKELILNFISQDGSVFYALPTELQNVPAYILAALKAKKNKQKSIAQHLLENFDLSDHLCKQMISAGASLRPLSRRIKGNLVLCKAAIMHNPFNYDFIDPGLWGDRVLTLAFLRKLETKRRSAFERVQRAVNKIGPIIEKFHKDDELIVCYLSRNNYAVKNLSDYLDNKDIVTALLINANSGPIFDYFSLVYPSNPLKNIFDKISPVLKKDKEIAKYVLNQDFQLFYPLIDKRLQNEIAFLKTLLSDNPQAIIFLKEKHKDNKKLASISIQRDPWVYEHISKRLQEDRKIVELALQGNSEIFKILSLKFRNDKNIALKAIQKDKFLVKYISEKLSDDKSFMQQAILYGASLKFASKSLKKDNEFIKFAVSQYNYNLYFADPAIKKDKEFLLKNFPLYVVFQYCSQTILQEKEIFVDGLNLDWRLIERRKMPLKNLLEMDYTGVKPAKREKIFEFYKKYYKQKDIFLLAKAKSVIIGKECDAL